MKEHEETEREEHPLFKIDDNQAYTGATEEDEMLAIVSETLRATITALAQAGREKK